MQTRCPLGYYPIPGDTGNCKSTDQTTIVKKVCPTGLQLLKNGTCGTGDQTVAQNTPDYCGSEYTGKNCKLTAQLVSSNRSGTEQGPNTICAFQENGIQFPCDPGCCSPIEKTVETIESKATTSEEAAITGFPWWLTLIIVFVCTCILLVFLWLMIRKHGRKLSK